jgi:soluble lytic murein transglycosylase-like protein
MPTRRAHICAGLAFACLLGSATLAHAGPAPRQDPHLQALLKRAVADSHSFKDKYDAEVWLTDMSHRLASRMPDTGKRLRLLRIVHEEAERAHVAPELVLAVIDVESDFHRFAISNAGARGLMQIMPFWLKEIGHPKDNLFHVRTNLRMGCTILHYYLQKAHGNLRAGLALYNGNHGRREYADRVLKALSERWYLQ